MNAFLNLSYLMPCVDDLVESLSRARFISTLDPWLLAGGGNAQGETQSGLQYRHWPMAVLGSFIWAPSMFQHLMDIVLHLHHQFAAAHWDDMGSHTLSKATYSMSITFSPSSIGLGSQSTHVSAIWA